ncbi:N-6 DNA methylase [Patescibacteria group bacterium]|nr:N-6 DNA methylase [Patescibacteria group bacterium]
MSQSTLFQLNLKDLKTEAEVETRLLAKLFNDLGYTDQSVIPKKRLLNLMANDGSKKIKIEIDFLLLGSNGNAKVVVEAKDPNKSINEAWGQAASYALSYNRDKLDKEKVKWLLISNGFITSLFKWDSSTPIVTLQLSDFASGSPAYTNLRSYIKYKTADEVVHGDGLKFEIVSPDELNKIFQQTHDLIWKREKLSPTDAFFEFCKFIFIKINEDKKRGQNNEDIPTYKIPLTSEWLDAQKSTSKHPVRDILFNKLRDDLEAAIHRDKKRRIFEENETFKLSASTCQDLIKIFEKINLSSIDEDLNGRMFEVFLNAAVRGRALGQYFTPRPVVDFMTRIALCNVDIKNPPKVMDACAGTAGFLIEVMAYLLSGLRDDTRFSNTEKEIIKNKICNEQLFGIEANERVARIARINMYLHGDGGSHIFHGDGLDDFPKIAEDMKDERKSEIEAMQTKIMENSFDLVLTNPPFSMVYDRNNEDETDILDQRHIADGMKSAKSNILFLDRYWKLLKSGGEILLVLDDTVLNGKNQQNVRNWIVDKFIILGVHSLPFNAFFKAKANIKTSILHLRKKQNDDERQSHIFMSISNNIGHDNSLRDTLERNNLTDILVSYLEWKRTGILKPTIKENQNKNENLECPEQIWITPPEELIIDRLDAFFYAPELKNTWNKILELADKDKIEIKKGIDVKKRAKINGLQKNEFKNKQFHYIEISDVTDYGLPINYLTDNFENLPSRGQYKIQENDVLMAINISSRGTVMLVPKEMENFICTSGFWVFKTKNLEESMLLWYSLRSDLCKKQGYYLAQTASQPELKTDAWNEYFLIPIPKGDTKKEALKESLKFTESLKTMLHARDIRFSENR